MIESFLTNFSETHRILAYLVIFFAVLVEGEVVLILAGIMSRHGHLDIVDVILVAFVAAVVHDLLYWSIGRRLAKSNRQKFLFFKLEKVKGLLGGLRGNADLYVFISKFAWNLNRLVLISVGYLKIPVKQFLRYSILAAFSWSITFVSLGHIFAYKTDILKKDLKTAAVFITVFIAIVVVFENFVRRMLKNPKALAWRPREDSNP